MLNEHESRAIQEVAKTTGHGLSIVSDTGKFIAKYIGGSVEQAMGMLEDHLKVTRLERQARLMVRVNDIYRQYGIAGPTKAIPLKLAIPLFQSATLEEDDSLQDRYAALLVNASNATFDTDIRRAYVSMLDELTALDVEILESIYTLPYEDARKRGVITAQLPHSARLCAETQEQLIEPSEEIALSLGNLARLGCLRTGATWGGIDIYTNVKPTILGRSLIHACKLPKAL